MSLAGIDISVWQAETPSLRGLHFAFARATYGTAADSRYAHHAANFRAAGIVSGAYAFGHGRVSGREQAKVFLAVARDADLLALDLESDGPNGVSMTAAQARDFIATVHEAGRTIGLYHSDSGFPDVGQDWNWVAKWGTQPPARPYAFWQWQGSPLDRDWFVGTAQTLAALAGQKEEMNVTTTIWPKTRVGTYPKTRRFSATAPFKEMTAAVGGTFTFDATVVIDQTASPHGTYVRAVNLSGAPAFLLMAKDVTLAQPLPDPALVSLTERVRYLEARVAAAKAALA